MKFQEHPPERPPEPIELVGPTGLNRCPFCHDGVEAIEGVACRSCLARHHPDCWSEAGSCASCGETVRLVAEAGQEPTAHAPVRASVGAGLLIEGGLLATTPALDALLSVSPYLATTCATGAGALVFAALAARLGSRSGLKAAAPLALLSALSLLLGFGLFALGYGPADGSWTPWLTAVVIATGLALAGGGSWLRGQETREVSR